MNIIIDICIYKLYKDNNEVKFCLPKFVDKVIRSNINDLFCQNEAARKLARVINKLFVDLKYNLVISFCLFNR